MNTRFNQSPPVQPTPEKKNLKKSGKSQKITFFLKSEEEEKNRQKKCCPHSLPILGGRDSTRALQSSPFQNPGGGGPLSLTEKEDGRNPRV